MIMPKNSDGDRTSSEKGVTGQVGPTDVLGAYRRSFTLSMQPFDLPKEEDISFWSGKGVLVFAPHQDDEVLGCGGTIKRLIDAGADVMVVYLTDGGMGSQDHEEDLVNRRKKEAINGLKELGCEKYRFLGFPDGMLEMNKTTLGAVAAIVHERQPFGIFLPNLLDGAMDHIMTSVIVTNVLRDYSEEVWCFSYEIWNLMNFTNITVDITNVIELKMKAMGHHRSQLKVVDYAEKFRGLNAYRSITVAQSKYAEAFLKLKREEQIAMMDKLTLDLIRI